MRIQKSLLILRTFESFNKQVKVLFNLKNNIIYNSWVKEEISTQVTNSLLTNENYIYEYL